MKRAPLLVLGCGMATAVGLTAAASCAAIRARLDGFRETRFMARGGAWIVGAEVPLEEPWRGVPRLARLVAGPVRECFDLVPEASPGEIPLLLGVAEPGRPGRFPDLDGALLPLVEEALGARLHPRSRVVPMGRVAGAVAVREAAKLANGAGLARTIVAGADSHLVAETLAHFDGKDRLLTERNSNGFIPGESAAAVLVGPDRGEPGLKLRSIGFGVEEATVERDEPLRADGLSAAYRRALAGASVGMHEIDYRIADVSGEQYGFKEAALALGRVMRRTKDFQDLWHPADCVGELGAAAVPLLLGYALCAARKGYAPGPLALAQAGNDDGRRVALVLDGSGPA